MRVRSIDWEGPLEQARATRSSILPGEFHRLYSLSGRKELDTTEQLSLSDDPEQISDFTISNLNHIYKLPFACSDLDQKKIYLQCRRPGFDSWVRKIPWRRKWQPAPGFWPGEFLGP